MHKYVHPHLCWLIWLNIKNDYRTSVRLDIDSRIEYEEVELLDEDILNTAE